MTIIGKSRVDGRLVAKQRDSVYKISNVDHMGRCNIIENMINLENKIRSMRDKKYIATIDL